VSTSADKSNTLITNERGVAIGYPTPSPRNFDWLRTVIRKSALVLFLFALAGLCVLYVIDQSLFSIVISFLWSIKEAILLGFASVVAGSIIDKQVVALRKEIEDFTNRSSTATGGLVAISKGIDDQSARMTNNLNVSVGQLTDSTDAMMATTIHLRDAAKKLEQVLAELRASNEHLDTSAPIVTDDIDLDEHDYWNELSMQWREAKDLVEGQISHISDGRKFRKYANMSRHDYPAIVDQLIYDGLIYQNAETSFTAMQKMFYDFRPQKFIVDRADWDAFQNHFKVFKSHIVAM
jgi:hypothetical protein